MRKIYRTAVPFLLTAFAVMPAQCMTFDVKSDFSRREVEVFGKASPESVITMIIVSDDDDDVVLTPENAQDKVFAGAQLKTDADGNFQKSFVFDNKESIGWYRATVYAAAEEERQNVRFYMPDESAGKQMLEEFNSASNEELYLLVEKYAVTVQVISVNVSDYAQYKEEISALIVSKRVNEPFASGAQLEKCINSSIAEVKLNHADFDMISTIISDYAGSIDLTIDEKYNGHEAETSTLFINLREARPSENSVSLLKEAMALTVLNNSGRSEILSVLKRYNDFFGVDLDKAEKYDAVEIGKALYDKNYSDAGAVKADYDNRIEQLSKNANQSKPSYSAGSGGGGGRTGSTGSNVTVDVGTYNDAVEKDSLPFKDLEGFEWAKEYIKPLFAAGIISGVSADEFRPDKAVKRCEVCKMMVNALGTEVIIGDNPFSDVSNDDWYADFVVNAYENKLISGFDGKFAPEESILRRDLALIVARALESNGIAFVKGSDFDDISDDDMYANEAISMLSAYGIISGKYGNSFAPADYVTRAEAAKIIRNMMVVIENE